MIFDWDDTVRGPLFHLLRRAKMLPSSWLAQQKLCLDAASKANAQQEAKENL